MKPLNFMGIALSKDYVLFSLIVGLASGGLGVVLGRLDGFVLEKVK